jgi:hypothetical protein
MQSTVIRDKLILLLYGDDKKEKLKFLLHNTCSHIIRILYSERMHDIVGIASKCSRNTPHVRFKFVT